MTLAAPNYSNSMFFIQGCAAANVPSMGYLLPAGTWSWYRGKVKKRAWWLRNKHQALIALYFYATPDPPLLFF